MPATGGGKSRLSIERMAAPGDGGSAGGTGSGMAGSGGGGPESLAAGPTPGPAAAASPFTTPSIPRIWAPAAAPAEFPAPGGGGGGNTAEASTLIPMSPLSPLDAATFAPAPLGAAAPAPSAGGAAYEADEAAGGRTPSRPLRLRLASSSPLAGRTVGDTMGPGDGLLGAAPIIARIAEPGDEAPPIGAGGGRASMSCGTKHSTSSSKDSFQIFIQAK